jgi:PPOX class probable F420-dependent enzyme
MPEKLEGRIRELLKEPNFAYVGTVREDGTPIVVPTWVDIDNGHVVLNSNESRTWPRRLRDGGVATVTVPDKDNPYEYVSITGRLVEETHAGADEHIDAMAQKYFGVDEYPARFPGEQRVILRLEPERIHYSNPQG